MACSPLQRRIRQPVLPFIGKYISSECSKRIVDFKFSLCFSVSTFALLIVGLQDRLNFQLIQEYLHVLKDTPLDLCQHMNSQGCIDVTRLLSVLLDVCTDNFTQWKAEESRSIFLPLEEYKRWYPSHAIEMFRNTEQHVHVKGGCSSWIIEKVCPMSFCFASDVVLS